MALRRQDMCVYRRYSPAIALSLFSVYDAGMERIHLDESRSAPRCHTQHATSGYP